MADSTILIPHKIGSESLMHFVAYLDNPNRSVEVDADNFISAQRQAAMLFGTRREHDVYLIACPQVKHTTAEPLADTTEEK